LLPSPHYLLTKRLKKCKTCTKILVKQGKDPFMSNQSESITFLLRDIVPKITIYRYSQYNEGRPLEVQLKFLNINDSVSKITLSYLPISLLTEEDAMTKKINAQCEFPKDQCQIESSDILNDFTNPQSQAQHLPKAFLLGEDEKQFLYKKVENFVIMRFQLYIKEGVSYNAET